MAKCNYLLFFFFFWILSMNFKGIKKNNFKFLKYFLKSKNQKFDQTILGMFFLYKIRYNTPTELKIFFPVHQKIKKK